MIGRSQSRRRCAEIGQFCADCEPLRRAPDAAPNRRDSSPARKSQAVQSVTCGAASGRCHAPPDRQADSAGWPGGVGQRPPGRQGSALAPACLIPGGPAPPAPTSPPENGAGSPMRGRTSGYRPAGLRREDPGRRAARLSGSPPGRIAGGLPWTDRPVRSVESSSPYRTDPQPSTPGSRPESSPRPTRRTAAQGHTGERL